MAIDFVTKIVQDPSTTAAVVRLINSVLEDPEFKKQAVVLSLYAVEQVLAQQSTTDQVVVLLKKYIFY